MKNFTFSLLTFALVLLVSSCANSGQKPGETHVMDSTMQVEDLVQKTDSIKTDSVEIFSGDSISENESVE